MLTVSSKDSNESKESKRPKKTKKISKKRYKHESKTRVATSQTIKSSVQKLTMQDVAKTIEPENLALIPHAPGRWSDQGIHCCAYDETAKTVTFRSCSFGSFALHTEKYILFPLKKWTVKPLNGHVEIMLETQFTKVMLIVSSDGYKAGIYVKTKSFMEELVPVVNVEFVSLKVLIKVCFCFSNFFGRNFV